MISYHMSMYLNGNDSSGCFESNMCLNMLKTTLKFIHVIKYYKFIKYLKFNATSNLKFKEKQFISLVIYHWFVIYMKSKKNCF